jgi:hypothetical protein
LAVAQRVAAAFGGKLEANSRLGEGSCFTLRLPEAHAGHFPPAPPAVPEAGEVRGDRGFSAVSAANHPVRQGSL